MLCYIVSHLREQALSSDCLYISATICDGLNNPKKKSPPIFWRKKKGFGRKNAGGGRDIEKDGIDVIDAIVAIDIDAIVE